MPSTSQPPSTVNSAAVTGRLAVNPPSEPDSSLWFSDREIGERSSRVALMYTADDFRQELARVERKLYWLSFLCVALAIIAVVGIIIFILM